MTDNISTNKRIAKNTIMLYIRMLLSIVVSLYTSRVVLNTLGVEDYGIYGVVGGVVAMFSFLNTSMSGATSRFLTYEMGRDDMQRLRETFSSALIVHIIIAIVVFILAETVGLWFLVHKLVIPENRMFAAHTVYQLSIFSTMVSITQVPYNATIIAHEKMDIYAYIELVNVFLKLLIVFLLPVLGQDKLIVYAILVLAVSFLVAVIYRIYCTKNYLESHFLFAYKKDIIYPLLSFSGWDLYGNMSVVWGRQGISFLMNMFFGPILNASSSIALTVQGVISSLSNNIVIAFRPQIIKSYAMGNYKRMNNLLELAIKFSLALFLIVAIPICVEIDLVLKFWLGLVPDYTSDFFRLIVISNIFLIVNGIIIIPIHATGKVKKISFFTGSLYLFSLVPMYFALREGLSPVSVYVILIIFSVLILLVDFYLLKTTIKELALFSLIRILIMSLLLGFLVWLILSFMHSLLFASFLRIFLISISSVVIYSFFFMSLFLNKEQRKKLYSRLLKKN